jgi:hypothetical protein
MVDPVSRSSPVPEDEAFERSQQRLQLKYLTSFEAWLIRWHGLEEDLQGTVGLTTPQRAGGTSTDIVALVYDLAGLCRDFILRDIWTWGALLRRRGLAVDEIVQLVRDRAVRTEAQTHQLKWQVGLSQLPMNYYSGLLGKADLAGEVWVVAVEESIPEFLAGDLLTFLNEPVQIESGRKRIEKFRIKVWEKTGQKVRQQDIWHAANYENREEFQRFQRGKGTPTAKQAFDRILKMGAEEFLDRRRKQELRSK